MLPILIVTVVLMLIAFFLFSVRLIFIKNGQFKGTCAGNNPMLNKAGVACGVCGRLPGEVCKEKS